MDSYSIKILGGNLSGVCDKCGKQSFGLYSADICAGEKTRRMVLCEDCLKKLNSFVERKNSEIQPDAFVRNKSGISEFPVIQSPTYLDTARNYTGDGVVCPECGNPLPAGAAFCKRCGSAVSLSEKPHRQKRKKGDSAFIRKLSPKEVIIPDILLIINSVVCAILSFFDVTPFYIMPFHIVYLLITVLSIALRMLNISSVKYNASLKTISFANLSLIITVILSAVNSVFRSYYYQTDYFGFTDIAGIIMTLILFVILYVIPAVWLILLSSEKFRKTRFGKSLIRHWLIVAVILSILFPLTSNDVVIIDYYTGFTAIFSYAFSLVRYFLITAYFIKRIRYGENETGANQLDGSEQNNFGGMTI